MVIAEILIILVAIPFALILLGLLAYAMIRLGLGFIQAVTTVVGRILEFVFGIVGDVARMIGAVLAGIVTGALALLSVVIGRWSAANHYAAAANREMRFLLRHAWSLVVRRPLRLLFLDSMLEGVEGRAGEAVRHAPGPDRPRGEVVFPGFAVVGSLPSGGSGAKLYVAEPDEATRGRIRGCPEQVVIKSFALTEGSSLPQIVRESRSLDSARRLGLVLTHELDESTFWYAMPYHPGPHLGIKVGDAHAAEFEDGLQQAQLAEMLGYAIDLVSTLARYHREGLWHKDVKPDNIIIHDGRAHLVDFGLVSSLRSAMTLTTHGTEYFRDPEMVRMAMRGVKVHEVNGAKFDIYGTGAVIFFMLENTFPGHGGLSRFERPAPEALHWIVRRAMTDYARRYESADEMLADLRCVAASADPWSVLPAMLPSMRSETAVSNDSSTVAPASPPPPPPPPPPPLGVRRNRRTPGTVTRAARLDGRRSAAEQLNNARTRAAKRRSTVPGRHRPGRPTRSLIAIVLGVVIAVPVAYVVLGFLDAVESELSLSDPGRVRLLRTDGSLELPDHVVQAIGDLASVHDRPTGSKIVLVGRDDHEGILDPSQAIDAIRSRLESDGWSIVDAPELAAEVLIRVGLGEMEGPGGEADLCEDLDLPPDQALLFLHMDGVGEAFELDAIFCPLHGRPSHQLDYVNTDGVETFATRGAF